MRESLDRHQAIVAAIEAKAPPAAQEAMARVIEQIAHRIETAQRRAAETPS